MNINLDRRLRELEDSLNFELSRYRAYKPGDIDMPDSTLLPIKEIIIKQPRYAIEFYSNQMTLPPEIYQLGAEAYQVRIDQMPYPELADMPTLYKKMAHTGHG